ncbi:phosphatidylserine lipase ABHD16A [Patella vulgata]|uniref:phosphatidylserine lipase ABHD16A n=1 Tax=Patella vulgata TaxID=6465 RepID=UPI00217FB2D5|nr:phosphatidylserine lipase ABHD16A [Patella vulgata]
MENAYRCLVGPRLYRIHRQDGVEGQQYIANVIESGSDRCLKVLQFCSSLSCWFSPILLPILYRKGLFTVVGLTTASKFMLSLSLFYVTAYFVRGIGRFTNGDYARFISILTEAQRSLSQENKKLLRRYDCELSAWPVDFRWDDGSSRDEKKKTTGSKIQVPHTPFTFKTIPYHILSYIAIHTFGRRMVYPGTTALMSTLVGDTIKQARAKLVEEKNGERAKLLTEDDNIIDSMFLDRRQNGGNGKTLVVCFEGNAGFYEIGCIGTPTELGFSVLGWNHPGYGESTGVPFPDQEQNAVDTVMQYAIHKLGFIPENICLFAWSIGGYSASWAAMQYPDVKQVILDATFDDIVPLATSKMPGAWKNLVSFTLRKYMNLNVSELLNEYLGPILIIRRSKDEIITTDVTPGYPPNISTNRGNFLLQNLLKKRYPNLVNEAASTLLDEWLAGESSHQEIMFMTHKVDSNYCKSVLEQYSSTYPINIGENLNQDQKNQLVLYLASKYMQDFDSTHCTPLPPLYFRTPWTHSQL